MIGKTSTPKFAKMVSWKYANLPASKVSEDLCLNHSRRTSRCLVQSLGEHVGKMAVEQGPEWEYALPEFSEVVTHIAVGRDGTTTPITKEGYRETMCGTIGFYGAKAGRMHTIYVANAPEHGKTGFDRTMDMELARVKKTYPGAKYIGLADGAKDNWTYLDRWTMFQILDFYHAGDHLSDVAEAMRKDEGQRKAWLALACHDLKHRPRGAAFILREMRARAKELGEGGPAILRETITYFENNLKRMDYARYQKLGYPIGSGVTEAGCKVVAKQRLSGSGMRWNLDTVQHMLTLRGLICTNGRWDQFWQKATAQRA